MTDKQTDAQGDHNTSSTYRHAGKHWMICYWLFLQPNW